MSLPTQLVPLFSVVINFKRLEAFALAASFNKNRTEIHFAALFEVEFRDVNGTRNGGAADGGLRARRQVQCTLANVWNEGNREGEKKKAGNTKCIRRFGLSGFHSVEFSHGPVCALSGLMHRRWMAGTQSRWGGNVGRVGLSREIRRVSE